jgi:hypothetical protein
MTQQKQTSDEQSENVTQARGGFGGQHQQEGHQNYEEEDPSQMDCKQNRQVISTQPLNPLF